MAPAKRGRTARGRSGVVRRRPAESGGIAGALALLIGKLCGIEDPETLVALGIVVGFVPSAVTWLTDAFDSR